MTNQNKDIESWEVAFDEKFGKAIPEELANLALDEFSRTDKAGCDGCEYNIWWRERIKDWIKSNMVSKAEMKEWVTKRWVVVLTSNGGMTEEQNKANWSKAEGYNEALKDLKSKLNEN